MYLGAGLFLCTFGSTTSIASVLGNSLGIKSCFLIISKTFSLVASRGDWYGFGGRISVFGLIDAFANGVMMSFSAFGCFSTTRLPNAVTGSGTRLGLGTKGTFSHGISRFWKLPI